MIDAIAVWHTEHRRFAQLLGFLERSMAAFHAGEEPDYALMRDAVHYLSHYGERFHHPREDVAFTRLVERDPSLQGTIDRLVQEHRVLAATGDALLECVENVLNDVVVERQTVETAARTYVLCYRQHLDTEENVIVPRAAQLLTPADWTAVAGVVATVPDLLFGHDAAARYRSLRDQIAHAA